MNGQNKVVEMDLERLELALAGASDSGAVDLHRQRASEIFGVGPSDVTDEQRRFAKMVGFREMYAPPRSSDNDCKTRLRQLFEAEQAIEEGRQRAVQGQCDIDLPPINGVAIRLEYNRTLRRVTHCYYLVESNGGHKMIRRKYSDMCRDVRDEFLKA